MHTGVRSLICLLFVFHVAVHVFAQSDSLTIVGAKWDHEKVARGVTWKTIHLTGNSLFGSNQNINIIEISRRARKVKLIVAYSDSLEKTSVIAERQHALAAINGSFFTMRGPDPDHPREGKRVQAELNRNRSIVYLRARGRLIARQLYSKDSVRKRHQQGVVAADGREVSILKADTTSLAWEGNLRAAEVMSSGPVLLIAGQRQRIPNDAFCNDRHPRTAVGKKADGTIVLLAVDGRARESSGMSIRELQKTLHWLGCADAINLDGGGSTTMYIKGAPYKGVVNYPTDNKKFDHEGEREVANALLLVRD
jgi:exopolysaccharide biosynthesis protein